jgi:hypothetical protein
VYPLETSKYTGCILKILLGISLAEELQMADKESIEVKNQKNSSFNNSFANKRIVFAISG